MVWFDYAQNRTGEIFAILCTVKIYRSLCHNLNLLNCGDAETYEALKVYIQMNMDGLKDALVGMQRESIRINAETFSNDMTTLLQR